MAADRRLTVAVFDVDETLIRCKSMFSFLEFAFMETMGAAEGRRAYSLVLNELREVRISLPREEVNRQFYRVLAGWSLNHLEKLAFDWFNGHRKHDLYFPETLAQLRWHQQQGHETVLLSGSAKFIIAPIAADLSVDATIAITLRARSDGTTDGEIDGVQTISQGKADALIHYLARFDHSPKLIGFGDHESDLPFLRICNQRFVIIPQGTDLPAWACGLSPLFVADPALEPTNSCPEQQMDNSVLTRNWGRFRLGAK